MMFKDALGQVIKSYRIERRLTQRQLASGGYIAHNYLSEVERGVKTVSSEFLENLAQVLNVPTYELIIEAGYLMAEYPAIPDTIESLLHDTPNSRHATPTT
jgi:transcriptional regulator with XRE-family HTH domain